MRTAHPSSFVSLRSSVSGGEELMAERADDAAHSVAERHDQKVSERAQAPRAAHREIVHIRHAVFKAAEDDRSRGKSSSSAKRGFAALALLYDLTCSYYPLPLCPSCRSTN